MQRLQQLIENLDTAASDAIKLQELKSYLSSIPPRMLLGPCSFLKIED